MKSMEFLWFSYSTPTPQNSRQIFTLLLLCLTISVGTAALLFCWLNGLLQYDIQTAGIASGMYAVAMFIFSVLIHPLRCVFTLIFPTLGTRQGRKLVLSMCPMIVVLYVLPNVATNIATITHLMKCTSENFAHSFLNSSELSNNIKRDMVSNVQKMNTDFPVFVEQLRNFNHSTDINVTELRESLTILSKHVEDDFSKAKQQVKELRLLSSRIFAAVLVFYLFMDSTIYLKSYLTAVMFDNVYVTGLLRKMAAKKGIKVKAQDLKNGVNSTGFRMTKQELLSCLIPILLITLNLLMTVMLILLDYIVYYLVTTTGPWLSDIPSTDITMQVYFRVVSQSIFCDLWGPCTSYETVNLRKTYHTVVGSDATQCKASPSKLDPSVLVSLGLLYILSYSLAFLEVYARRLRRKVASSFFQEQEEKRMQFLIGKILAKKKRQKRKNERITEADVDKPKPKYREVTSGDQQTNPGLALYEFARLKENYNM